jgi:hypothetical protein
MTSRRTFLSALGAAPVALALSSPARAATPEIYAEGGIAIDGTDPVSYFTDGRPVAGSPAHALEWRGATWRFASAEQPRPLRGRPRGLRPAIRRLVRLGRGRGLHRLDDPRRLADRRRPALPQLLARCAAAVGAGHPRNIARADANWPGVLAA